MKKKRILLGIALTAASIFALTACGNNSNNTDGDGAKDGETQTYKVTFYSDAAGTTVLKEVNVAEGGTVSEPTETIQAPSGKKFAYWTADGVTQYNFDDEVIENTSLKPVFVNLAIFDELSTSSDKILASDFTGYTLTSGDSFDVTEAKFYKTGDDVTINSLGQVKLEKANVLGTFGGSKSSGVLKVCFNVSFDALQGEAFFQLDGNSATKENTEVFGLRTKSSKFQYRFDGSSTESPINKNGQQVAVITKNDYEFLVELDMNQGKLSITLDGEKLVDSVSTNISSVRGIKFTCKNDGTSTKYIDNVAVTFKAGQKSALQLAKEAAITEMDAKTLSTNDTIKAAEQAELAKAKVAVNSATDTAGVDAAKTAFLGYVDATKYVLTVNAYTAASTAAAGTTAYTKVYKSTETVDTSDISFSGYNISGIYTDEGLSTAYTAGTLSTNTALYAKVTNSAKKTLDLSAILGTETSVTVNKGVVYQEIFTFWGKDVKDDASESDLAKRNVSIKMDTTNNAPRIELTGGALACGTNEHKPANCIGVTCDKAGTITVKMINKAAHDDTNYTGSSKECKVAYMTVTGTIGTDATGSITKCNYKMPASDQYDQMIAYEIPVTAAGTYYIGASHNGCYIYEISFQ